MRRCPPCRRCPARRQLRAFLRDNGGLDLNGGFRCRGRRCDRCSGLRNTRGDGGVGRSGRRADGLADGALRVDLGAVGLGVRGRSQRCVGVSVAFRCGRGWSGLACQRSRSGDRRGGDRKRRRRLVGCRRRGSGRCRRGCSGIGDGDGNGVGRHHGRSILRCLGLILCRSVVAGRCLLGFIGFAGLRRIGLRCVGFQPCAPCRPLRLLWRRLCRRRVRLAAASRSLESLRAALSDAALSDAAALSRERLSDAACESSERRGAGAESWALILRHDCRCCWRPHCCRPAPRNCRFRRIDRNRPARTSPVRPEKTRLPILLT